MPAPNSELPPAAVKLKVLLRNRSAKDFADRLGLSETWLSQLLNRTGDAAGKPLPIELMLYSMLVFSTPPDIFEGTAEWNVFTKMEPDSQAFARAIAAYNFTASQPLGRTSQARADDPKLAGSVAKGVVANDRGARSPQRQGPRPRIGLADFFAREGIHRSGAEWSQILDGSKPLRTTAAERRKIESLLGLPAFALDKGPQETRAPADWVLIDRMVLMKLSRPGPRTMRKDNDPALLATIEQYLDKYLGLEPEWGDAEPEWRDLLLSTIGPIAALADLNHQLLHRNKLKRSPTAHDVLEAVARHLPRVPEEITPAARAMYKSLKGSGPDGTFVKRCAFALSTGAYQVDAYALALLLLGLARTKQFPEIARRLNMQFQPKREAYPARPKADPIVITFPGEDIASR